MFVKRPKPISEENEEDLLEQARVFSQQMGSENFKLNVSKVIKSEEHNSSSQESQESKVDLISPDSEHLFAADFDLPIIERDISNVKQVDLPRQVEEAFPKPFRRPPECEMKNINSHEETNDLLANMSSEEIELARSEILNRLDASTIEFLRTRKKNKCLSEQNISSVNHVLMQTEENNTEETYPISLKSVAENRWLNMEVLEEDKLEWTRPILLNGRNQSSQNARFSFDGVIVMNDLSTKEGLHHHGEEPHRAGYTLSELYNFIQSSFSPQKLIGLRTLAKIMSKTHKGYYDECFNCVLSQELLDKSEILLFVRKGLDDTNESVVKESLNCLHSIVCNTLIDEICLDRIFPFITKEYSFFLEPEISENLDFDELTDDQLIKLDVIRSLLRFDTMIRFQYILNHNVKYRDDLDSVNQILDILIRFSRHSVESCKTIIASPNLLETIMNNFLPYSLDYKTHAFQNPFPKAIKLIRLLSESGEENASQILNDYPNILKSLQFYLTLDHKSEIFGLKKESILHITLEALRTWIPFIACKLDCAKNEFKNMLPLVIEQLKNCSKLGTSNIAFDFQYASTIIKILTCLCHSCPEIKNNFEVIMQSIVYQWTQVIINSQIIPLFDAMSLISSGIEFLIFFTNEPHLLGSKLLKPIIGNAFLMRELGHRLKSYSYLLKCKNEGSRDAKSLPSFGSIYFGGETISLVPYFDDKSVLFFTKALLNALILLQDRELTNLFLTNNHILSYINQISRNHVVSRNLFRQMELQLLQRFSLCCGWLDRCSLPYYKTAMITVCNINETPRKEDLINYIIFNEKLLNCLVSANIRDKVLVFSVQEIKQSYVKYSSFDKAEWIFDPIIELFKSKEKDEKSITMCLIFIQLLTDINESYFHQIMTLSKMFTIIATVFLLSGSLFFNEMINRFLINMLKYFVDRFLIIESPEESLEYVNNVGTIFNLLLECFESESYGEQTFGNFLLIFCQSRSHPEFRKLLFSEYGSILRYIRITRDHLIIPLDRLLYPIEENVSIAEIYLRSLLSGSVKIDHSPLVYLICVHHLHWILFKHKDKYLDKEEHKVILERLLKSLERSKNAKLVYHLSKYNNSDLCNFCDFLFDVEK